MKNVLPFITQSIPPIPAQIKAKPEDFIVDEIPSYLPVGTGEHTYIQIQKEQITTHEVIRSFCSSFGIKESEVGFAGLKDAQAVSRQWFSFRLLDEEKLARFTHPKIKILNQSRHKNKLRIGHLKGNQFEILLRGINEEDIPKVEAVLKTLKEKGIPNYFGEQRFGQRLNNHWIGKALFQKDYAKAISYLLGDIEKCSKEDNTYQARQFFEAGDYEKALNYWPHMYRLERKLLFDYIRLKENLEDVIFSLPRKMKFFYLSAYQSYLFNLCLSKRMNQMGTLYKGDVAAKYINNAQFDVEDADQEQPRLDDFEISATGPLFGPIMKQPSGYPQTIEEEVLASEGVSRELFNSPFSKLKLSGDRRSYRIPLKEVAISPKKEGVLLSFFLPKGCYATIVLREITKV